MGHHYSHLSLDERQRIANWLEAKIPIAEIANRLGCDASTIYRDIKRNRHTDSELPELDGYHAEAAQDMNERRRAIHRKMIVFPELKVTIEDRLKAGWSPEQIAGRMRLERYPIRVGTGDTIELTSSTCRACLAGLTASQRAQSSGTGNVI